MPGPPPDAEVGLAVGLTAAGGHAAKKDEGATPGQQSFAGAQRSDGASPTKKQRTASVEEPGLNTGPVEEVILPADNDVDVDVHKVMSSVVEVVIRDLPSQLVALGIATTDMPLHMRKPMCIPSKPQGSGLSDLAIPSEHHGEGYWCKRNAAESVKNVNMYEARGNAFWFNHRRADCFFRKTSLRGLYSASIGTSCSSTTGELKSLRSHRYSWAIWRTPMLLKLISSLAVSAWCAGLLCFGPCTGKGYI